MNIYIVFALGIYAGLRKIEIVNARWEWFDFDNKLIVIKEHDDFRLKDYESRTLPFHHKLTDILSPIKMKDGFLLSSGRKSDGKYRYRYEFKKLFKKVVTVAKLEWVTPHVLRHTFGSQLAMAGVSIYKISQWMGHSHVETTKIYAHLQKQDEDINSF